MFDITDGKDGSTPKKDVEKLFVVFMNLPTIPLFPNQPMNPDLNDKYTAETATQCKCTSPAPCSS